MEFVKPGSEEAEKINYFIKEAEPKKLKPGRIVRMMRDEGFPKFSMHYHTQLWRSLDAKKDGKGHGINMDDGQWYWYARWVEVVRQHCEENRERYA